MGRDDWTTDRKHLKEQRRVKREWGDVDGTDVDDDEHHVVLRIESMRDADGQKLAVFREAGESEAYYAISDDYHVRNLRLTR